MSVKVRMPTSEDMNTVARELDRFGVPFTGRYGDTEAEITTDEFPQEIADLIEELGGELIDE